jgi:hypothetical protein
MVAYSTSEPFVLEQLGAAYRTFEPAASGIDFYGDNLCTSEAEVQAQPDRVAAFTAASLKGWAYALANKDATVDLIIRSYSNKKSRDALLFEAEHTEALVGRDPARIGEQDPARWRSIAATYRQLGLLADDKLPAALIWDGNGASLRRWLIVLLFVTAGLVIAALVAYRGRRSLRGTLARLGALPRFVTMRRPRLSLIMSLLFIGLSIPVLIFILIYNYNKNSAGMVSILNDAVAQTSRAGVERTQDLIENTESPLRFLAELASADPGYFRTEQSNDLLYRALTSGAYIDAAYVSFEDGYHRVVTRIDEDRRRADPKIPATANWHASYIDAITYALSRVRHRKFFDIWPNQVGKYDVGTDTDIRRLPGYQSAKTTRTLAVTEPSINLRSALAGDHLDAGRRFRRHVEENKSIDFDRDHRSYLGRAVLHLFRLTPAVAPGRKRVPAIAGDRKPQFRCARASAIEYPGNREAGIGGFAAANIAEIVLLLRSARRGPAAHQVGHSADPWRRAAVPDGVLFRSGEFFEPLRNARA